MTPSEIEPLHVLSQPENEEDCKVVTLGICIYVQLRITDGTSWSWISFAKKKRGRHCYTIYGVCHEVTFFEGEVTTEKMCPKSGCPTLMSLETCSFCLWGINLDIILYIILHKTMQRKSQSHAHIGTSLPYMNRSQFGAGLRVSPFSQHLRLQVGHIHLYPSLDMDERLWQLSGKPSWKWIVFHGCYCKYFVFVELGA